MVKKLLISVCFSALILSLNGQSKFSYKISIEPIFSSSHLQQTNDSIDNSFPTKDYISRRENADKPKIGIKIDFGTIYTLSKSLKIYTGLFFINQKVGQSKFIPIGKYPVGGNFRYTYDVRDYEAIFNYIGLPLGLKYDLIQKSRLLFGIDCSLNLNYLINTSNNDETLIGDIPKTDNKELVFGGNIGVYAEIIISENFSFDIKPEFGYSITPNLVELSSVSQKNYYFGLNIGLILMK
jgi:hypothetical protein